MTIPLLQLLYVQYPYWGRSRSITVSFRWKPLMRLTKDGLWGFTDDGLYEVSGGEEGKFRRLGGSGLFQVGVFEDTLCPPEFSPLVNPRVTSLHELKSQLPSWRPSKRTLLPGGFKQTTVNPCCRSRKFRKHGKKPKPLKKFSVD